MNVTFVLPDSGNKPVGGYKVVYEYSKKMSADGHRVTIVYSASISVPRDIPSFVRSLKSWLKKALKPALWKCDSWYALPPVIRQRLAFTMSSSFVPDADAVFATSWETAEFVARYPESKGKKFYLIQHFEDWSGDRERVLRTWKLPLAKIVIAPWLQKIADEMGEKSYLVENGFDFGYFTLDVPIASKDRHSVCMLYHTLAWKGSADGIEALKIVKESEPDLRATFFGVPERPEGLPEWIAYYMTPDRDTHNRIYNEAAIFVGPSLTEGFGLTPAEAMQCGCAVACTDNGGYAVFATHGETALVSPVSNPSALAGNVLALIRDDGLRMRIAERGHEAIQRFTWDAAYEKLRAVMGNV